MLKLFWIDIISKQKCHLATRPAAWVTSLPLPASPKSFHLKWWWCLNAALEIVFMYERLIPSMLLLLPRITGDLWNCYLETPYRSTMGGAGDLGSLVWLILPCTKLMRAFLLLMLQYLVDNSRTKKIPAGSTFHCPKILAKYVFVMGD